MQTVHDVHHQNGDVTQAGAAGPQVGEGLVSRRVNHQQARHLHLDLLLHVVDQHLRLVANSVGGEVGGADLLCDPPRLHVLHVGVPDLVQQFGLARVHVAQDAADRGPQLALGCVALLGVLALLLPSCLLRLWSQYGYNMATTWLQYGYNIK
jgi:hypothetical protein